jgi:UDP-N-acetylglucosamine--N-acetylmuramyl-(pentapeptide) pyrophosphoryl-undecaprenol N-acetylglucosamine transferase
VADAAAPPGAETPPTPAVRRPRVVIAGGGTGGHAFPALALAQALTGPGGAGADVVLVGTSRGPERLAAQAAGIRFEAIDVIGFRRALSAANVVAAAKGVSATMRAIGILRHPRADVAVGTGGYASIPVAVAAGLCRIPLIIQEQNALPGRANRLAGRWAAAVAVSFPGSQRWFRAPVKMIGNPVRPELADLDKASLRPVAQERFGLDPARRTLLVFGGSQGARRINEAALGAYPRWRDRDDLQVLHLVGALELPGAEAALAGQRQPGDTLIWRLVGFTDRMDLAYAAADLGVTRAGAATMFEIAAAGLPAIVVPYPHAGNHQRYNALPLLEIKAIRMIDNAACTPATLGSMIDALLADPELLLGMSAALRTFARPDAARALSDLVLGMAGS